MYLTKLKKNQMLLNPTLDVPITRIVDFYNVDGLVSNIINTHIYKYDEWISSQPVIGDINQTLEQVCWMILGSLFALKSNSGRTYRFYLHCTENHDKTHRVYDMDEQNGSTWFKLFLTKK